MAQQVYRQPQPRRPRVNNAYTFLNTSNSINRAGTIAGTGTVAMSGFKTRIRSGLIAGIGTVAMAGSKVDKVITVVGTGTVAMSGYKTKIRSGGIVGTGAIAMAGKKSITRSVAISGNGTINIVSAFVQKKIKYIGYSDKRIFFAGTTPHVSIIPLPEDVEFSWVKNHYVVNTVTDHLSVDPNFWNWLLSQPDFQNVTSLAPAPDSAWETNFGLEIDTEVGPAPSPTIIIYDGGDPSNTGVVIFDGGAP